MQLQTYKKYKPLGIDWLGEIPEGWTFERFGDKFSLNKNKNKNLLEKNLLSLSYGKIIKKNINTNFGLLPESFDSYQIVENGYIILRLTDLQNDKKSLRVGLVKEKGIITSAYVGLILSKKLNSTFIYYLLYTFDIIKVFYWQGGSLRQQMGYDDIKVLPLLYPDKQTQTSIADYLDKQTALLDKKIKLLIAKKQSYIKLKRAIINEALTKGVDKAVKMKDSDIEWIGEIPEHWMIKRLKDEFHLLPSGIDYFGGSKEYLSTSSIGENCIVSIEEVITYIEKPSRANMQPRINTAWFAKMKDTNKSYLFSTKEECEKYILSTGFCAFDVNKNHPGFIKYYIISGYFTFEKDMHSYGTTQFSINDTNINKIHFIKPPKSEQIIIANYLDDKTAIIEKIIKKTAENILALQEFRKTLINDVVTGKVKII